ncbi:MAG: hypothetical protein ACRD3K_08090 [Edaphobacter sp.]
MSTFARGANNPPFAMRPQRMGHPARSVVEANPMVLLSPMKNLGRASAAFVLFILCFGGSFIFASDYGDGVISGAYRLAQNDELSTLILKPDHTFQQDLTRDGSTKHAKGSWRHLGEGGIALSKEFLRVSGQEPGADGTAYGEIHKPLGFLVSLELARHHVLWYGRVDSSTGEPVVGIYAGDEPGVSASLILKPDHTFEQTVTRLEVSKHAVGSWTFNQSGDIVFSKEFLKTSAQPLRDDETASAWNPKGSDLQIVIAVPSSAAAPIFRKRQFFW